MGWDEVITPRVQCLCKEWGIRLAHHITTQELELKPSSQVWVYMKKKQRVAKRLSPRPETSSKLRHLFRGVVWFHVWLENGGLDRRSYINQSPQTQSQLERLLGEKATGEVEKAWLLCYCTDLN